MHILFLTDNFPPEVNAPASRTYEHAREWVKAGHRVTVITCAPNFPRGQVFDGYRNKIWQSELMDGIRVIRVWTYITANEGFYKRTLDYVSFMVSGFLASLSVAKVDVIVGTSPHFFTAIGAFIAASLKGKPWVFELRDMWPESIKAVGALNDGLLLSVLEALELFLYRRATRIVSVTHSFKHALEQRGIDGGKIAVVTNGADLSRFAPRSKPAAIADRLGLAGCFVAGYVGTHGLAHGLDTLIDAAALLAKRPEAANIRIVLLGDGARKAELVARASALGLPNLMFIDSVPKQDVPDYWALLDVSIIHLKRDPLFTTVIPSKLFESMAMGVPILHGVLGESAAIIQRDAVGETFEPENAEQLTDALLRLSRDATLLARYRANTSAAAPHYDRAHLASEMLSVLAECAARRPATQARDRAVTLKEEA